ncbi:hypothetical protein RHO14_05995 [Orbus wheelerorum]|uniref:hypothetical protein n=1 Tax=Orbus wheelerorum TaxID=3074111 RepID=UPI00370D0AD9
MPSESLKSIVCQWSSNSDQDIQTKVKAGVKKVAGILLRRIPKKGKNPGHYWIEVVHEDENQTDDFIEQARIKKLKEQDITTSPIKPCTKPNGFRESYGWYPEKGGLSAVNLMNLLYSDARIISADGYLNGDCEARKKEDKKLDLTYQRDREAGRKKKNNELSSRPFDPHQNGRLNPNKIIFSTNPHLLPNDVRTVAQVLTEIRKFAQNFNGEWSWNGDGFDETNCHTFLFLLLAKCNLADPLCIGVDADPHFNDYYKSLKNRKKIDDEKFVERKELMEKLLNLSKYKQSQY